MKTFCAILLLMTIAAASNSVFALSYKDMQLLSAARSGDVSKVNQLLKDRANPNARGKECKNTPLIEAAHQTNLEIYRLLLKHGAKVNQRNKCSAWTPLMGVARYDATAAAARLLIENGATVNDASGKGWRALGIALGQKNGRRVAVAEMLVDNGATVDELLPNGITPLMSAARNAASERGSISLINKLIARGADVDFVDDKGWNSWLYNARYLQSVAFAKSLIDKGVDRTAETDIGWSALHLHARYQNHDSNDLFEYLLALGLDVNESTDAGYTPLMMTAYADAPEFAEMLIKNGAETSIRHKDKTALDYAVTENSDRVTVVLNRVERQNALAIIQKRNRALPVDLRKDKYIVALTQKLKSQEYNESLLYFSLLEQFNAEISPSFMYFWGEALLETHQPKQALVKLYQYIERTGAQGQYYSQALELSNQAEERLSEK